MPTTEIEKSKPHILIEIIEYVPGSVARKAIIRKTTGNISVVAVDTGQTLTSKILPFDIFIQVIEGVAVVVINKEPNILQAGKGIVIPAHAPHSITSDQQFKMISTVIKSGYEGLSI
ncbi:MAG: cupin domain-containing protein [Bacteroidales bacterium]|nr:cupin domain-containing protein [Bacteroidales bacterium]